MGPDQPPREPGGEGTSTSVGWATPPPHPPGPPVRPPEPDPPIRPSTPEPRHLGERSRDETAGGTAATQAMQRPGPPVAPPARPAPPPPSPAAARPMSVGPTT